MFKTYEEALFRYGITCAENLLLLGRISQEDYIAIENYEKQKKVPPRKFLERIFSEAKKRIGKETPEAVEDYFLKKHNSLIDRREGNYKKLPKTVCESCKVQIGQVTKIEKTRGIPIYRTTVNGKSVIVIGKYFEEPKIGDSIVIHNHTYVQTYSKRL